MVSPVPVVGRRDYPFRQRTRVGNASVGDSQPPALVAPALELPGTGAAFPDDQEVAASGPVHHADPVLLDDRDPADDLAAPPHRASPGVCSANRQVSAGSAAER